MIACAPNNTRTADKPTPLPAFAALYERYYPLVFAWTRRRVGDYAVAEDLTAQTFSRAWEAFGRYEERGAPITAWLMCIARHEVAAYYRRRHTVPLPPEQAEHLLVYHALVDDRLVQQERATWVREHIRRLPAAQQQALWLRFGEAQSFREIGLRLDRSEGAAKLLLHRALRTLRVQARAQPEA